MIQPFGFKFTATDNTGAAFGTVINYLRQVKSAADNAAGGLTGAGRATAIASNNVVPFTGNFKNAGFMVQNFGNQVADAAVMLEMGADPMRTMIQQGSQMLAIMGPLGGALGAAVAVFGTLAVVSTKTGKGLGDVAGAFGVLAPAMTALGSAASAGFGYLIDGANLVVNNLDRLMIAAGVAAGFFATRWAATMIMSGAATAGFTGALGILRVALLRLPIVGLVVAATELIYQFLRLVDGAGSFGSAMDILADIGRQAFDRVSNAGSAVWSLLSAAASGIQSAFLTAFGNVVSYAGDMVSGIASMVGPKMADAIGLNAASAGIKSVGQSIVDAGTMAGVAADHARSRFESAWAAAGQPIDMSRMTAALAESEDKAIDLRDVFTGTGDAAGIGGAADAAGKSAKSSFDMANKATVDWVGSVRELGDNMAGSIGDGINAIVRGTKTGADAFRDMAADILGQLWDILVTQRIVAAAAAAISGTPGTGSTGILGGLLGGVGWTPTPKAVGGNVHAGMPYLVGDKLGAGNAELFIPGTDGRIDPSPGGDGGTVNVYQTINLSAGVKDAIRQEMAAFMPQMAQLARDAVLTARQRGKPA